MREIKQFGDLHLHKAWFILFFLVKRFGLHAFPLLFAVPIMFCCGHQIVCSVFDGIYQQRGEEIKIQDSLSMSG